MTNYDYYLGRQFRLPLPLFCLRRFFYHQKLPSGKKSSVQVGLQILVKIKSKIKIKNFSKRNLNSMTFCNLLTNLKNKTL